MSGFRGLPFWFGALSIPLSTAEGALSIHLNDLGGLAPGTEARQSFDAAADYWSGQFADDVVVNLDVGFVAMNGNRLGGAEVVLESVSYSEWKAALTRDASTASDQLMVANLPSGDTFAPYINRTSDSPHGFGSEVPYVDHDGGFNNDHLQIPNTNAKALGLLGNTPGVADAAITINSSLDFDFDASDGVGATDYSLTGIFIHEIGHTLGFVSGVDVLDYGSAFSIDGEDDVDFVMGLDFTRFSEASENAGADFDWTADERPKYFSIDGGTSAVAKASSLGDWSTGAFHGDGFQNSHWRRGSGLGSFEPVLARGATFTISEMDLLALDVIGWTPAGVSAAVPEPSWSLAGLALLAGALMRRDHRQ